MSKAKRAQKLLHLHGRRLNVAFKGSGAAVAEAT